MQIFRDLDINWLGKKWLFLTASLVLIFAGAGGYWARGGLSYGVDFTGGTIVYVKFNQAPDLDAIREALRGETAGTSVIQAYDEPSKNMVQIRIQSVDTGNAMGATEDLDGQQKALRELIRAKFDTEERDNLKIDINNTGAEPVENALVGDDPKGLKSEDSSVSEVAEYYAGLASALMNHRDKVQDGLLSSIEDLRVVEGVDDSVLHFLKEKFYAGPFAVKGVESVGAVVGADLRRRAAWAVGLSFLGMLTYIAAISGRPVFGVAAIVALLHDLTITLGLFAITQKEISLSVVAALLTLVGYSVNDTIVIFQRVRENLRLMRKDSLTRILNVSINQTLARTVMTSGMTFLAVVPLLLFGGEVLNGFAFALTAGVLVGTYSSVAVAAPIVDWLYQRSETRSKRKAA